MDSPKPLKRSKELVPLSKEHHEGLLFAWKIKQGLRNGTDVKVIAGFIQWFWSAVLENHFRKEEELLLPHLPAGHEWVAKVLDEHNELEALVRLAVAVPDEDMMTQLAEGLISHIRFEERTLFPYAEKRFSPAVLESLYPELLKAKPYPTWEPAFWLANK